MTELPTPRNEKKMNIIAVGVSVAVIMLIGSVAGGVYYTEQVVDDTIGGDGSGGSQEPVGAGNDNGTSSDGPIGPAAPTDSGSQGPEGGDDGPTGPSGPGASEDDGPGGPTA